MNSQENHNATNDNEEGARSGKRVRFHLPPLPSSSRPNSVERELALEKYFLTDHLAQSLLHEHFFGETHFQDRLEEVEHCAACISPTPPSKMTLMAAIEHPESAIEADPATPYDDDRAVASLTGTEQKEECERHQQPQRKRRKLRGETTRLKDIIGHASVKLRIDELILPLGLPAAIADSVLTGIRSIPASILLHGPPGCGKTKLARAIAGEARAAFFSVAPSDVLSKFVGESEASIRNIFRKAVEHALQLESKCAVVFFDEIDALGQSRGNIGAGEGEGCSRRVLAELLLQLNVIADRKYCTLGDFNGKDADDEVDSDDDEDSLGSLQQPEVPQENLARIIVAAATNRVHDCDSALLRRFGIQLEVGLPSWKDRKKMLARHLRDIHHLISNDEFGALAAITEQWSGSSLESLAREAVMCPIRECLHRAAVIRRHTEKREQRGGDASGQEDAPESPDMAADICLLEGVQKLRPVTVDDFHRAITTLTGEELPVATALGRKSSKQKLQRRSVEHYDSSSSSDEEH